MAENTNAATSSTPMHVVFDLGVSEAELTR
jgi:hypothetical protein